jgi:hypothetical protein
VKSLSRTISAAAVVAAFLGSLVFGATSATAERTVPSGTSAEQTVAFGVPAWMGRMFWNQVNKQHTTPRCFALCGLQEGPMA